MNLSGSGFSWSLGPRGASIGIGKRGTFFNAGIPGTGLSSRQRIGTRRAGTSQTSPSSVSTTAISICISVSDDGTLIFKDSLGQDLSPRQITVVKRQHGEAIRELIQNGCDLVNKEIESVGELHMFSPLPQVRPTYVPRTFADDKPQSPIPKKLGFFYSLFKNQRDKAEAENESAIAVYKSLLQRWEADLAIFEESEQQRRNLIEKEIYTDSIAMEQFLVDTLQDIVWPRETNVSTEIFSDGVSVFIDVDLPEIEDMPNKKAAVPSKGYKLSVKELSPTAIQKLYMQHVHGIGFRIIGEAFSALPKLEEVVFSGYSQRADKTTGQISDEYLLSVRVPRSAWEEINFENLASLDVVEALTKFDLRRSMLKAGVFKPIVPFAPTE